MPTNTSRRVGNKLQQALRGGRLELAIGSSHSTRKIRIPSKKLTVKLFQFGSLRRSHPIAPQSDRVEPADTIVPCGDTIRRQVLTNRRTALHQRQPTDADKLVNQAVAGNKYAVVDLDMAGEQSSVRHDDVIADQTIVPYMTMRHEESVGSDDGVFLHLVRAMNGKMFPEDVPCADFQAGRFISVFQILRGIANDAAGVKHVSLPHRGMSGNVHLRSYAALGADFHMGVDDRVRTDLDAGIEFGIGVNDGGGVNHRSRLTGCWDIENPMASWGSFATNP